MLLGEQCVAGTVIDWVEALDQPVVGTAAAAKTLAGM